MKYVLLRRDGEIIIAEAAKRTKYADYTLLTERNLFGADPLKHVPVLSEKEDGVVTIQVGEVPHPVILEHRIIKVFVITEDNLYTIPLPGGSYSCVFNNRKNEKILEVISHCNIHGLWSTIK